MTVNSKAKGNSGEREIARIFSESLGGSFVRSNASGGFIGGKNAFRKNILSKNQITNTKGDIVPPDNMAHLVIECKSYKEFRYHQLFTECIMLDGWIKQAKEAADKQDFWILVFKANRMPWSIVFDGSFMKKFQLKNYTIYNDTIITDMKEFLEKNKDKIATLGESGINTDHS